MRKLLLCLILVGTPILTSPEVVHAQVVTQVSQRTLRIGSEGMDVAAVQLQLTEFGYVLPVDGVYGPKTVKAVKAWQRSNGLLVDGIVGPATAETLQQADRVTTDHAPAPPAGLSLCDEMSWYRQQAGLPDVFDAIGKRESNCQNDAKPTSTVARRYRGWWSVGVMHIHNAVYGPGAAACGITSESDYYGTSESQKRASACFAKVLYDHSGMSPWAT